MSVWYDIIFIDIKGGCSLNVVGRTQALETDGMGPIPSFASYSAQGYVPSA